MKPLHLLLSFLLMGLFFSCTENDEPLALTSLQLKYNVSSNKIPINKEVTFQVKGDNFVDYTDQMTLLIDGQAVSDNTYTFEQVGEFEVQATYNNKVSNTVVFTVSKGLSIDRKSLLKNQIATFTLYNVSTGDDITQEGTFYINGSAISGNTFSTEVPGSYTVYAEYTDGNGDLQTTDMDTLEVVVPTQRVLIEDYTGTWCGYCPRLQGYIAEVMELTDDAVAIAIHSSSSDVNPDPYEYEHVDQLIATYNPYHQFPLGRINRTILWSNGDPATVLSYTGGGSPIGIAVTTRVNENQLNVDVRLSSTQGLNNKKIVVAALENNLFHEQTNYLNGNPNSPWYQAGNPIPNYENDHVLRHAMTNIFGDPIAPTDPLEDFKKSYSMDMSSYYENPEDAEVVVLVLADDGTVLQVKKVGLNEQVGFE